MPMFLVLDRLLQKEPATQISEAEVFRCEICEMQFSTKRGLRVHFSKVHLEQPSAEQAGSGIDLRSSEKTRALGIDGMPTCSICPPSLQ